ncbi:MAG: hypothetical protein D6722_23695 [Bacteroidetes bacterium]|nr:MAG: hypothetical protein D6722_23695 [Bacteroidota bacterium]
MSDQDRIIGTYSGQAPGAKLFFLGGIHGNEPAGVHALARVFAKLHSLQPPFRGSVIGVRGNMAGLAARKRFVDKDLNRLWSEEEIARVRAMSPHARNTEEKELIPLLELIESYLDGSQQPEILIDLHTTSAPGGLFSIVTEDTYNRDLAAALHAPIIFKLTTSLTSTTNIFMENRNIKGLAFESGQHDDPTAVDNHEAAIWLLLEKAGCLEAADIPDFEQYHYRLISASRKLPHYLEVVYRHEITSEDEFHMHPGYQNFHEVYKEEPLGRDREGEVRCPETGLMLMPLYQPQGEEGFFIIQKLDEPPQWD